MSDLNKREELAAIRGKEEKQTKKKQEGRERRETRLVEGPQTPIMKAETTIKQAESYKTAYGSQITWGERTYDLGTVAGWKAFNQAIREAKSQLSEYKRQRQSQELAGIRSRTPEPATARRSPITEVGPPQIATPSMINELRAQGYDLPAGKTVYISPSGQPYYYEGEIGAIEEPDRALSMQLWEEAALLDEAKTGKLFGVIPYSKKGIRQVGAVLAGSVEQTLTPILRIIPGEQPFELVEGEIGVSWRNVEGIDHVDKADMAALKVTGYAAETGITVVTMAAGGFASGKVLGAAGGLVPRIPIIESAVKYAFKPRLITNVALFGGLIAAEGIKIAEMVKMEVTRPELAAEVTKDILGMYAFDVGLAKGLESETFLQSLHETIPVKRGKVSVPLEGGGTAEWSGFYLSKGDDAAMLTGTVKIKDADDLIIATHYVPETNIESEVTLKAMRSMGYDPTDIRNIEDIRAIVSKTQDVTSKYIDDIFPIETGTLSETGVDTLKKYLLENIEDVEQVYGSFAVKPQLKTDVEYLLTTKGGKTISALRTPGDIDIQLLTKGDDAVKFTDDLAEQLLKVGEKVRINPESPTLIEALVGEGKWAHAVDIHVSGDLTDTIPALKTWGFSLDKASLQLEGLPTMGAGEQGIRKASSIMGFPEPGRIGPKPHRMKDIPDFFQVQDTLISSMRPPDITTQARLNELLGRYGGMEKLVTEYGGGVVDTIDIKYTFKPPPSPSLPTVAPLTYLSASYISIKTPSSTPLIKSEPMISSPVRPSPKIPVDLSPMISSPLIKSEPMISSPVRPSPKISSSKFFIPDYSVSSKDLDRKTPSESLSPPSYTNLESIPSYRAPSYIEPSYLELSRSIKRPYPLEYKPESEKKTRKRRKKRKAAYEFRVDFKEPKPLGVDGFKIPSETKKKKPRRGRLGVFEVRVDVEEPDIEFKEPKVKL